MKPLKTSAANVAVLAAALALAGCASPARVEMMQVSASDATRTALSGSALRQAVTIGEVSDGTSADVPEGLRVSARDFEQALVASLRNAGLLAPSAQDGGYALVVKLNRLDQPAFGFNMTVKASVYYSLVERKTGRVLFARVIDKPFTAAFNEAFAGVERLKLAREGAIRTNIQALIDELAAVKVTASELRVSP